MRGLVIPPQIWGMPNLNFQEKGFLSEIIAVADGEQTCELSNEDFAGIFSLSKPRASEIVKSLEAKGCITVERLRKGQAHVRRIRHTMEAANDNRPGNKEALAGLSQCQRVLVYMETNGSITSEQARVDLGIARLASRMTDLRKAGHQIEVETVELPNRFGEKCRVARYTLGGGS